MPAYSGESFSALFVQLPRKQGYVHHGDNLVVVSDLQAGEAKADSIQLRPVK